MSYVSAALMSAAHAKGDHNPAAMAQRMGVPYLTAYRWATGRNKPGPAGLAAIERAYGLTPAALLHQGTAA